MDLQAIISAANDVRQQTYTAMRLGDVIDALKQCEPSSSVIYDFGELSPDVEGVDSYRGHYSDLAIGWCTSYCTVSDLLSELRSAVGKTFEGYKGGNYRMTRETPLWVAKYGGATSTSIVRVEERSYCVVLHTAMLED